MKKSIRTRLHGQKNEPHVSYLSTKILSLRAEKKKSRNERKKVYKVSLIYILIIYLPLCYVEFVAHPANGLLVCVGECMCVSV